MNTSLVNYLKFIVEDLIELDELAFDLSDTIGEDCLKVQQKIKTVQDNLDSGYKMVESFTGVKLRKYRRVL